VRSPWEFLAQACQHPVTAAPGDFQVENYALMGTAPQLGPTFQATECRLDFIAMTREEVPIKVRQLRVAVSNEQAVVHEKSFPTLGSWHK